jgi:Xaa-Pro aminopeptidase
MRAAGRVGTLAVEAAMSAAQDQATEADVVTAAVEQIYRGGGVLYGLGLSSGSWAHTFSPTRPAAFDPRLTLRAGDMVRLDIYGSVDGYMFDFGRSKVVGGDANADQAAILDAVIGSVQAGLEVIRAGPTIGEVARRCDEALASSDFAARVGRSSAPLGSWGHSLGLCWEPPWIEPDNEQPLEPGMCLAVELRIEAPGRGGANYEENVIVTRDGYELLSDARPRP